MAHISSIGAGMFSDLAVSMPSTPPVYDTLDTQVEFDALFATEIVSAGGTPGVGTFVRVRNIREFPQMGTPPQIVNVPTYGQKTSQQIQGQADAPNFELTLNFVPSDWAATTLLGAAVGNGTKYAMRFTLLNTEPSGNGVTRYASSNAGVGSADGGNSMYYFVGKIEALLSNPQLSDANQATLTISIQSAFYGAYTV
jgi:hypothetical protein